MSKHTKRSEHPLAAVVTHWLHVVALFVLIFTGFYIHSPFWGLPFGEMRHIHLWAAFILVATGVFRIYWAFLGSGSSDVGETRKIRDYHFFFPQKENRGKLWQMVKYYLFLRKTHPCTAKYNPLQKIAYVGLAVAIFVHMTTGMALWHVTQHLFIVPTYWIGGPIVVRELHYLAMWAFILITAAHIYIVSVEAPWEIPLMFWWKDDIQVSTECVEDRPRHRDGGVGGRRPETPEAGA